MAAAGVMQVNVGQVLLPLHTKDVFECHFSSWSNLRPLEIPIELGSGPTRLSQIQRHYAFAGIKGPIYRSSGSNRTQRELFKLGSRYVYILRIVSTDVW